MHLSILFRSCRITIEDAHRHAFAMTNDLFRTIAEMPAMGNNGTDALGEESESLREARIHQGLTVPVKLHNHSARKLASNDGEEIEIDVTPT